MRYEGLLQSYLSEAGSVAGILSIKYSFPSNRFAYIYDSKDSV
jgi:hypothetical protein